MSLLGGMNDREIAKSKCPDGWRVLSGFEIIGEGDQIYSRMAEIFIYMIFDEYKAWIGRKADDAICVIRRIDSNE